MPALRKRVAMSLGRGVEVFFRVEAGLEGAGAALLRLKKRLGNRKPAEKPETIRSEPTSKDREIARLRTLLAASGVEGSGGVRPENLVWVFGVARTGSTWLSAMMGALPGYAEWKEPYVGDVFGYAYYTRAWDWMRSREEFVLGAPYKKVWLNSIRNFVLEGANARFPELSEEDLLVIKEPNGSLGAPLLSEALPESRMILLIRDPRDVVASLVDAQREGSWTARQLGERGKPSDGTAPDEFVRQRANLYMASVEKAKEAYDAHRGPKSIIKYEDLRADAFGAMKRAYETLGIPVDEKSLARAVEEHAWEKVPEKNKGQGKFYRKAEPGGWREDLTPEQARTVEEITAPILEEFYTTPERLKG